MSKNLSEDFYRLLYHRVRARDAQPDGRRQERLSVQDVVEMIGSFIREECHDDDGQYMGDENAGIQFCFWWGTIFEIYMPSHSELQRYLNARDEQRHLKRERHHAAAESCSSVS